MGICINNFLKVMARNDVRIRKSYESKTIGGYIFIGRCGDDEIDESNGIGDEEVIRDVDLRYELIYNSLGKIKNSEEIWNMKRDLLFEYCDTHKKTPPYGLLYKKCNIYGWLGTQKHCIKDNNSDLYKKLSENIYIKAKLDEYLNPDPSKTWDGKKEILFEFCNIHKRIPIGEEMHKGVRINKWYHTQKITIDDVNSEIYAKLSENPYIKKNIDDYLNPENIFNERKNMLFEYCNMYKKVPDRDVNKDFKCGGIFIRQWLDDLKKQIKDINSPIYIKLSENPYVKDNLDAKIDQNYRWNKKRDLLFEYCNLHNKAPTKGTKYTTKLINWLQRQKAKITNKNSDIYIKLSVNPYIKKSLDKYLFDKYGIPI